MLVADGYDKQRNGTKDTETTGSDEDVHGKWSLLWTKYSLTHSNENAVDEAFVGIVDGSSR